jgi:hypothetical protein
MVDQNYFIAQGISSVESDNKRVVSEVGRNAMTSPKFSEVSGQVLQRKRL